jgi:hypothetical protein
MVTDVSIVDWIYVLEETFEVLLFNDNLEVLVGNFDWTCGALGILDGIADLHSMKT